MDVPIDYFTEQHWDNVAAARGFGPTSCTDVLIASMREGIGDLSGRDILDVGVGNGVLAVAYAAEGARVTGIDLSWRTLRDAQSYLDGCLRTGVIRQPVRLAHMDAQQVSFDDGSFDVVTMLKTIWVFPDPALCLAQMARVLRPAGRLLIHCWEAPADCTLVTTGARVISNHVPSLHLPPEVYGAFSFTPRRISHLLLDAGFRDVSITHHGQKFDIRSADHYWELFRSLAGTAYYAFASQPESERSAISAEWLAGTNHLRSGGHLRLSMRWMIVSATPAMGDSYGGNCQLAR